MSKYSIELWSRQGILLADISPYVEDLRFAMQRNEAEDLEFEIDLNAFEAFCTAIGTSPTSMLSPYQTDIKVRRNGTYLFGTHVGDSPTDLDENDQTIGVRAFGYLNLLIDRYVSPSPFVQVDAAEIAWQLIDATQSETNGDLDMTQGAEQATTLPRDRTYEPRQNVKQGIINLTNLVDGNFDFRFTHERVFETYDMIGTDQSSTLKFIYGGPLSNVLRGRVARTARGALYNKTYGLGSGFGSDQLQSTEGDNDSQLNFGLHERIASWNSVTQQAALDQNTAADVARRKALLEMPQFVVSGEDFDLNSYGIGDRITAMVVGHPFLATVNGVYRIERIEVLVDENDAEEIKLFFDNQGLDDEG